jgi:hypothetical protein
LRGKDYKEDILAEDIKYRQKYGGMTMEWRYKLEIELDDEKILADDKYYLEDIYNAIRQMFAEDNIKEIKSDNGIFVFESDGTDDTDYAKIWFGMTSLFESKWFKNYAKKMDWYDKTYGMINHENVLKDWLEKW